MTSDTIDLKDPKFGFSDDFKQNNGFIKYN